MAAQFVMELAVKLFDWTVNPVKRHLSYVFQCKKKIAELEIQLKKLDDEGTSLEQEITRRSCQGDEIESFVQDWKDRVTSTADGSQTLLELAKNGNNSSWCPNLKIRWQVGRKAALMSKDITDLLNEWKEFRQISYRPLLQEVPAAPLKYQPSSRQLLCDEILKLFENPDVKILGCYGMGGIGKTTLANEVKRLGESWQVKGRDGTAQLDSEQTSKVKDVKLFEKIVMVTVFQSPVITRIQGDIADSLGLILTESSESSRASSLYASLKKMKILIILDDIWQVFDLQQVGIPCGDGVVDQKVLLISRNLDLLEEMNSANNFEVPLLKPSEAVELFKSSVKVEDENLAEQILQKCGGHPLAITVVAGIVRGRERSVWIDTLNQLERVDTPQRYEMGLRFLEKMR